MDVLCIGELLVDRIIVASTGRRFFGGAPANVAVNYAKLGGEAAIIAKVGDDPSGRFLLRTLRQYGVDCEGVVVDRGHGTTEVYIGSERSPCCAMRDADAHLRPDEVSWELVKRCRILHTSAFALAQEPSRSAVLQAVRLAKEGGKLVSLEFNYRPEIWPKRQEALTVLEQLLCSVDMVKPSLEDARSLYGEMAREKYLSLLGSLGPGLVVLTLGAEGCLVHWEGKTAYVPGYEVEVVNDIGAGDAFWAGFLWSWLGGQPAVEAARFGNAVAALKVAEVGAIARLPLADKVYAELESRLLSERSSRNG